MGKSPIVSQAVRRSEKPRRGHRSPRNRLNALTGRQWIRFTRSWFVHNPPPRSASEVQHPAKFPEPMVAEFIEFFTRPGESVLDPFMGVGSTVKAAARTGRVGYGVELNPHYFALARQHLGLEADLHHLFCDDAARLPALWEEHRFGPVDFCMTSPPYWDMLGKSRGNVFSTHQQRAARGLDVVYSEDPRDLGNLSDYGRFLEALEEIFRGVARVLRPGAYLVVVAQNLRSPEGRVVRLAWDLADVLDRFLSFQGERIWCQDNKKLGIWGYPRIFVSNVHHHYCLVFRKPP